MLWVTVSLLWNDTLSPAWTVRTADEKVWFDWLTDRSDARAGTA